MSKSPDEASTEALLQHIQHLERLLELSRSLNALQDEGAILQTIVDATAEITDSEEATILLYDEGLRSLRFAAAHLYKREAQKNVRMPLDNSLLGEAFRYCSPIVVQDAQSDPRFTAANSRRMGFPIHSLLAVPLTFQGSPIGVLMAANKLGNHSFGEEEVRTLETLASQTAATIKSAGLLRETQKSFEELAELDQKRTDFIAITSHEFRTPLGLILGHVTYLSETVPEKFKPQLEVILRSAMRLKEVVEDLSKADTFEKGKARLRKREVNLNLVLQDLAAGYQREARAKEVSLTVQLPSQKLILEGDAEKICIAVSHLLKNAITFTDRGGQVELRAEAIPGYVKISVSDNGIGVPEKDLERIFERFYQVEEHMTRRHGGMGLGLSVAKMMVEMHGGHISVKSRVGEGSTFAILLPTSQTQRQAAQRVFSG